MSKVQARFKKRVAELNKVQSVHTVKWSCHTPVEGITVAVVTKTLPQALSLYAYKQVSWSTLRMKVAAAV